MGYTDGNSITSSKEHRAREGDAKGSASADDPRGGRFRSRRDADRGGEQQSAGAGETLALQDVVTWGKARPRARGLLPAQLPEGFRFMCAISQSAGTPHVPTQAPALLVPQDVSVLLRAAAPQLSPLSRWAPGDWQ